MTRKRSELPTTPTRTGFHTSRRTGNWIVFLSFPPGTENHGGKMGGMRLSLMSARNPAKTEVLTNFFGGQGTINVNSWSPNSKEFAYVVYEPRP